MYYAMVGEPRRMWLLVIIGILSVLCGIAVVTEPLTGLLWLTVFAGSMFVADGIIGIITYFKLRSLGGDVSASVILLSIMSIILGAMIVANPLAGAQALVMATAAMVSATGIMIVVTAFKAKKFGIPLWGWLLFAGIINILLGIALFANPTLIAVFVGISLIMNGITLAVFGFQKR